MRRLFSKCTHPDNSSDLELPDASGYFEENEAIHRVPTIQYLGKSLTDYRWGVSLGKGMYGEVFEALHVHTGRRVAIKVLDRKKLTREPRGLFNLEQEIMIHRQVGKIPESRNYFIQLLDVIHTPRKICLVLELALGTLQTMMDSQFNKVLPETVAQTIFRKMMTGLHYIHSIGIIHKDIKPQNVMLMPNLEVKLSDFGVSEVLSIYDSVGRCTRADGSPAFQCPEIAACKDSYLGFQADIWSAGVTLYVMLTGKLPFAGSSILRLYANIVKAEYSEESIPINCKSLLDGMLEKDETKRWDSGKVLAHPWLWESPNMSLYHEPLVWCFTSLVYVAELTQQDDESTLVESENMPFYVIGIDNDNDIMVNNEAEGNEISVNFEGADESSYQDQPATSRSTRQVTFGNVGPIDDKDEQANQNKIQAEDIYTSKDNLLIKDMALTPSNRRRSTSGEIPNAETSSTKSKSSQRSSPNSSVDPSKIGSVVSSIVMTRGDSKKMDPIQPRRSIDFETQTIEKLKQNMRTMSARSIEDGQATPKKTIRTASTGFFTTSYVNKERRSTFVDGLSPRFQNMKNKIKRTFPIGNSDFNSVPVGGPVKCKSQDYNSLPVGSLLNLYPESQTTPAIHLSNTMDGFKEPIRRYSILTPRHGPTPRHGHIHRGFPKRPTPPQSNSNERINPLCLRTPSSKLRRLRAEDMSSWPIDNPPPDIVCPPSLNSPPAAPPPPIPSSPGLLISPSPAPNANESLFSNTEKSLDEDDIDLEDELEQELTRQLTSTSTALDPLPTESVVRRQIACIERGGCIHGLRTYNSRFATATGVAVCRDGLKYFHQQLVDCLIESNTKKITRPPLEVALDL